MLSAHGISSTLVLQCQSNLPAKQAGTHQFSIESLHLRLDLTALFANSGVVLMHIAADPIMGHAHLSIGSSAELGSIAVT